MVNVLGASVLAATVLAIAIQRLLELRVARRNAVGAKRSGAREFGARHYPLFFVLHTAWLVGFVLEALRGGPVLELVWLAPFVLAQGLRYWAISALGSRWNTRVLVIPGAAPVARGPYRFLAHPNYVAVVVELASVPLIFGAVWTAAVATVANLILLLVVRIPCENRALAWAASARG